MAETFENLDFYQMAKSMRNDTSSNVCTKTCAALTIEELCAEKAVLIEFMTIHPEILEKYRRAVAATIQKRNSKSRASCHKQRRTRDIAAALIKI